jgi:hypothetical protein
MSDDSDRLWVACIHVIDGTAAEVWCRPDRLALCPPCVDKGPDGVAMDDLKTVCPACLAAIVRKTAAPIEGREYLERDGIAGHIGHN